MVFALLRTVFNKTIQVSKKKNRSMWNQEGGGERETQF